MVLTAQPRLRALPAAAARRLVDLRREIETVRLRQHVERLAEPRGRRHAPAAMDRAEAYVARELESADWLVRRRPFTVAGTGIAGANLLAHRPGRVSGRAPDLLVGAHLDTVPGSPGADDNASGVAGLLELARILPAESAGRVRLVVFDEEETGLHGARALATELAAGDRPTAVVVFECVGYTAAAAGSQRLPPAAALAYPGQVRRLRRRGWRGDWTLIAYRNDALRPARLLGSGLAQLGGPDAVVLARDPLDIPFVGPLLRRYLPAAEHFARSDHQPFWDLGIPAIQVTDTADFRNPHYHRPGDIPGTLDYERLADITAATAVALGELVAG
ncbi:M20/M25/M40 family metallo-hydrolase [Solwaraspora sp. WMMD1047]|uniref:M20/M25/M40 family metallo-hydrolase n=1 Tax=Solwaraspora sp. WMMD1047 TaxID=3016102 RepID=UPI002415E88D|nr:M20/M25/M40 family metallo-hydrolase [Solwaraspora sp. WMMD1047]MDG4829931.1 M20/M25/M40 family metallo-hydrolase [Solwaraspora sp. WMMD1047]